MPRTEPLRAITPNEVLPPRVHKGKGEKGFAPRGIIFCTVDGCDVKVVARGWCNRHWVRWRVYGDPLADHRLVGLPGPILRERRRAAAKPRMAARRQEAKVFVAAIRDATPCAHCGGKMSDWHNPDHVRFPDRRVGRMVSLARSFEVIMAEIAVCTPLCRRCHMAEDDRLALLPLSGERNGEHNGRAKLDWPTVREIRNLAPAMNASERRDWAKRLGIAPVSLQNVVRGITWKES